MKALALAFIFLFGFSGFAFAGPDEPKVGPDGKPGPVSPKPACETYRTQHECKAHDDCKWAEKVPGEGRCKRK